MGLLNFFGLEKRNSQEERAITSSSNKFYSLVTGGSSSGNINNFEQIPALKKAIKNITTEVNKYDLVIYQYKDSETVKYHNDVLLRAFNKRPNSFMNREEFLTRVVGDMIMYDKAYIKITKREFVEGKYVPVEMEYVPYELVTKYANQKGRGYYFEVESNAEGNKVVSSTYERYKLAKDEMIEIQGYNFLENNRDLILDCLNFNETSKNQFINGALPCGVLETESRLTKDMAERLRDALQRLYSGSQNVGKTMVLEEGLKYKQISQDPDKMALPKKKAELDSRIEDALGIERGYLTGVRSAEMNERFENTMVFDVLNKIQSAFDLTLLSEKVLEGYACVFDRISSEELSFAKLEKLERLMKVGSLTINQANDMVGLPKLKGKIGDYIKVNQSENFFDPITEKSLSFNSGIGLDKEKENKEEIKE